MLPKLGSVPPSGQAWVYIRDSRCSWWRRLCWSPSRASIETCVLSAVKLTYYESLHEHGNNMNIYNNTIFYSSTA